MGEITRIESTARMSQVAVANGFAFVSGQVSSCVYAAVSDQTREIFQRIDDLLATAGTDKSALVSASVWLTDVAYFDAFNDAWDHWLTVGHAPARACVHAQLMKPGLYVEVAVVASV